MKKNITLREKNVSDKEDLCDALKARIKTEGLTYKDLAVHLQISESTVKRMFQNADFSMERLGEICEILGISLGDFLTGCFERDKMEAYTLTEETELRLSKNTGLFSFFWRLQGQDQSPDDIAKEWKLSLKSMQRYLAALEKLGLILRLPHGKIRLRHKGWWFFRDEGPIFKLLEPLRLERLAKALGARGLQGVKAKAVADGYARFSITPWLTENEKKLLLAEVQELTEKWTAARNGGYGERKPVTLFALVDEFDQYEDVNFPIPEFPDNPD